MNRRLSMVLAAYGVWFQTTLLVFLEPAKEALATAAGPGMTVGDVRVLGLSLDGFAMRDLHHVEGWLPQLGFVVLSGLLSYGVLRGSPGLRPRFGAVLALVGAALLAAGAATLLGAALDPEPRPTVLPTYGQWLVDAAVGEAPAAAAAQFGLCTVWLPVVVWFLVWRYRRWQPLRRYLKTDEDAESAGSAQDAASHEKPGPPPLITARGRRHLVCAGLIPAVLLAVAGGPVLRHRRVGILTQGASVTFDPDLWDSYHPPAGVDEWSGVLYPALRLRPLRTELTGGWIAALVVCAVFLLALAVALRSLARRAAEVGRWSPAARVDLVMKGWYATLLAAVVAAFVDGRLLRWLAEGTSATSADRLEVALGDAVRFGTAWGWTTGLACLGVILLMKRREDHEVPRVDEREEQPVDAE